MRISDWSSDVCSSDLVGRGRRPAVPQRLGLAGPYGGVPRVGGRRRRPSLTAPDGNRKSPFPSAGRSGDFGRVAQRESTPFTRVGSQVQSLSRPPLFRNRRVRSEEHTSELPSLMRTSYAVCCFEKKKSHK